MRQFILILFTFSLLAQSQTSSSISRDKISKKSWKPKSLKSLKISIQASNQENPGLVDEEILRADGIKRSELSAQSFNLSLSSKWSFRPLKRMIVFDTATVNSLFYSDLEGRTDKVEYDNHYSFDNEVFAMYVIDRNNQVGSVLKTGIFQERSYQLNAFESSIQRVIDDHVRLENTYFYQRRFSKKFSTRFNIGGRLYDYEEDYSSFDQTIGQQNDRLELLTSIENTLKVSKNLSFKIPLKYRREFYKNRIALLNNGAFPTDQDFRPRDDLEIYQASLLMRVKLQDVTFETSVGYVEQNDQNFKGLDYDGVTSNLSLETKIERTKIKANISGLSYKYDNALTFSSANWKERELNYGVSSTTPIDKKLTLQLAASRALARDNYYGGRYDNDVFQAAINYSL